MSISISSPVRTTAISPPEAASGEPGTVLAADRNGILVACGEGALRLLELQKAGGKRLAAAQFLAGTPLPVGTRLALPA